jgi:hypothetical protein
LTGSVAPLDWENRQGSLAILLEAGWIASHKKPFPALSYFVVQVMPEKQPKNAKSQFDYQS